MTVPCGPLKLLVPRLLAVQKILCVKAPVLFSEVNKHESKVTRWAAMWRVEKKGDQKPPKANFIIY